MSPARNKTRRANPTQLTFASEYRGTIKRVSATPGSGNPTPPDYEGNCTLNGDSYWISGWINRTRGYPVLDLVFQLAVTGNAPHRHKPEDLRLRTEQREKPTQKDLDWSHYMQAPRDHRESGACERCNRVQGRLDSQFGQQPPY